MKPTQDSERLSNLHRVTQLVSGKAVKKNDNILSCRGKLALSHCYVMKSKRWNKSLVRTHLKTHLKVGKMYMNYRVLDNVQEGFTTDY